MSSNAQKRDDKNKIQNNQKDAVVRPAVVRASERKLNSGKGSSDSIDSSISKVSSKATAAHSEKFIGPSELGLNLLKPWHDYGAFALYRMTNAAYSTLPEAVRKLLMPANEMDRLLIDAFPFDTQREKTNFPENLTGKSSGYALHLVQFVGPIKDEWLKEVEGTGATLVHYIANNGYVVWTDEKGREALGDFVQKGDFLQYSAPYHPYFKLGPTLRSRIAKPDGGSENIPLTVQIYNHDSAGATQNVIASFTTEQLVPWHSILKYSNTAVKMRVADIVALANQPDVFWIGERFERELFDEVQGQILASNFDAMQTGPSGPGYKTWLDSFGFSTNQNDYPIVDVTDDGIDNGDGANVADETLHEGGLIGNPDRVPYIGNCTNSANGEGEDGHGHLNINVAGGFDERTGAPFEDADGFQRGFGINPYGRFAGTRVFDPGFDLSSCGGTDPGLIAAVYNSGARIQSNSWGCGGCAGTYDDSSQAFDAGTRDALAGTAGNQQLIMVFAAGNDGPGSGTIGTPGNGKNMITVGASENDRLEGNDGCGLGDTGANNAMDVISFSSRGPSPGNRKKPEVIGPGTHISGTATPNAGFTGGGVCGGPLNDFVAPPADAYFPTGGQTEFTWSSGTSHSTPAVAGIASLYHRWLNTEHGITDASPAMIKAYLIAHPTYLTGVSANDTLPSNNQGYGMPDMDAAFDNTSKFLVDQTTIFGNSGDTYNFVANVADPSKPVRIVLNYTDAPGAIGTSPQVNDLNLEATVGGNTYLGNVFSGAFSVTGGAADTANNYEAVFLPAGTTGSIAVQITAFNIAGDGVPNSLVGDGIAGGGDPTDQDFAFVCYNCTQASAPVITAAGATINAENCSPPNGVIDPDETVTIDFSLQNVGTTDTVDLVATLQATGGVTNPSGPQNYGVLVAGGSAVTRSFTFTASATCGDTIVATFDLDDDGNNLGTVAFNFQTGATVGTHMDYSYTGPAVPFPDNTPAGVDVTVNVAGFSGQIGDVDFSIDGVGPCSATNGDPNNGITHTWVGDLILKLTSPEGTTVTLVDRPGAGANGSNGTNICDTLFDDESGAPSFETILNDGNPPPLGPPFTGSFTPQNSMNPFEGEDPNGTWTLNISDNANLDVGTLNQFTIKIAPFECCEGACPVITVNPATLPNGQNGVPYDQTVSATGGTAPYTFAVSSGTLPTGLTLNPTTGQISGTPTVENTFNFDITATDDDGCTGTRSYSVTIGPVCANPPTITTMTLPNGAETVAYNQTVQATGGTPPYTWSVSAGTLPTGLTLNSGTGVISGTPTTAGTYNFTVMVTDTVVGCSDTQDLSIVIDVAPACNYEDLFDDGTLTWLEVKPTVTETGGNLVLTPSGKKAITTSDPVFLGCQNCTITAEMSFTGGDPNSKGWLLTHRIDKNNQIEVLFKITQGKLVVKQKAGGLVAKAKADFTFVPSQVYVVEVNYDGTDYEVRIDGVLIVTLTPVGTIPSGIIGAQSKEQTTNINRVCQTP